MATRLDDAADAETPAADGSETWEVGPTHPAHGDPGTGGPGDRPEPDEPRSVFGFERDRLRQSLPLLLAGALFLIMAGIAHRGADAVGSTPRIHLWDLLLAFGLITTGGGGALLLSEEPDSRGQDRADLRRSTELEFGSSGPRSRSRDGPGESEPTPPAAGLLIDHIAMDASPPPVATLEPARPVAPEPFVPLTLFGPAVVTDALANATQSRLVPATPSPPTTGARESKSEPPREIEPFPPAPPSSTESLPTPATPAPTAPRLAVQPSVRTNLNTAPPRVEPLPALRTEPTPPRPAAFSTSVECASCGTGLSAGPMPARCPECDRAMCDVCRRKSVQFGNGGRCPACSWRPYASSL